MAQAYNQQEQTGSGKVLSMDGKALRGTRIADQERRDQVLSVYDVQDQLVVAQAAVDTKENEIVAALRILEQVAIAGKAIIGDADLDLIPGDDGISSQECAREDRSSVLDA